LAEYRYTANPPLRTYRCVVKYRGRPVWRKYKDVVLDDSDFVAIGEGLDKEIVHHHGLVGQADCRLLPLKEAVDHATEWMRTHRKQALSAPQWCTCTDVVLDDDDFIDIDRALDKQIRAADWMRQNRRSVFARPFRKGHIQLIV
jgi:hypothetical protein